MTRIRNIEPANKVLLESQRFRMVSHKRFYCVFQNFLFLQTLPKVCTFLFKTKLADSLVELLLYKHEVVRQVMNFI